MIFFDMNSKNTFNYSYFWFSNDEPKSIEWPKWLTLPVHYQDSHRHSFRFYSPGTLSWYCECDESASSLTILFQSHLSKR